MSDIFDVEFNEENLKVNAEQVENIDKKHKPFSIWTVGGRDYKLRLTAGEQVQLEDVFKTKNIFSVLLPEEGVPSVAIMLRTIQAAMNKFEHGMTKDKIFELYDKYVDEGGTFDTLFVDVIVPTLAASGFFSWEDAEEMQKDAKEAKANARTEAKQ